MLDFADITDRLRARSVALSGSMLADANLWGMVFDDVNLSAARRRNVDKNHDEFQDASIEGMRINGVLVSEPLEQYRAMNG